MIRVKVNVVITLIMLTFMLLHILSCAFGIKNAINALAFNEQSFSVVL